MDRGFGDVNGLTQIETERPDVEAPEKYPCPAACASPWRLPSRTAITHVRWLHGQSGHESTDYTQSVVHCVGRWTGSSMCARTRMRREVNVRPRPLVWKQTGRNQKQRQRQNNTRQDMRHGQDRTGQDRTGQDRTGQDRTGQDRTGQDRTGQDRTGQDRTGQDRTGQDTSTGHFECAHHLSSVFCRCSDGGPIRLLVFVRRRLSWRAHVVQAEAAHCPLGAKRACKNGRFPQAVQEWLNQERGLQFYHTRSHAIVLYRVCMKAKNAL